MKTYTSIVVFLAFLLFLSCGSKEENDPDIISNVDVTSIVPQQFIDQVKARGMNVFMGNRSIRMNGIIYHEGAEIDFAFESKLKSGDFMEPYIFAITRQNEKNEMRLTTGPDRTGGHRMIGEGIITSSNGENFTIFAKTAGTGAIGRKEYEKLWVISGTIKENKVIDMVYTYQVLYNEKVGFVDHPSAHIIVKPTEARFSKSL